MIFFAIIPAIFFGWSLGRNDASSIYGTAVANGLVKYSSAIILSAVFVLIGALLEGANGLETIGNMSSQTLFSAAISTISAAITVTILTNLGLPVSASQAIVGSILGIGLLKQDVDWGILTKVVSCWIATPIGGIIFGYLVYKITGFFFNRIKSLQVQTTILKVAAMVIGAYGSYALGANKVANITGPFVGIIPIEKAALIGGLCIMFGVLTCSKKVIYTVGKKIIALDHFSAVVALLAQSITIWIFAIIGVPVSTSQAVVGAVIGAGFARGSSSVNGKTLKRIVLGWLATPLAAAAISASIFLIGSKLGLK